MCAWKSQEAGRGGARDEARGAGRRAQGRKSPRPDEDGGRQIFHKHVVGGELREVPNPGETVLAARLGRPTCQGQAWRRDWSSIWWRAKALGRPWRPRGGSPISPQNLPPEAKVTAYWSRIALRNPEKRCDPIGTKTAGKKPHRASLHRSRDRLKGCRAEVGGSNPLTSTDQKLLTASAPCRTATRLRSPRRASPHNRWQLRPD